LAAFYARGGHCLGPAAAVVGDLRRALSNSTAIRATAEAHYRRHTTICAALLKRGTLLEHSTRSAPGATVGAWKTQASPD